MSLITVQKFKSSKVGILIAMHSDTNHESRLTSAPGSTDISCMTRAAISMTLQLTMFYTADARTMSTFCIIDRVDSHTWERLCRDRRQD